MGGQPKESYETEDHETYIHRPTARHFGKLLHSWLGSQSKHRGDWGIRESGLAYQVELDVSSTADLLPPLLLLGVGVILVLGDDGAV